jgi:hypothetical protein
MWQTTEKSSASRASWAVSASCSRLGIENRDVLLHRCRGAVDRKSRSGPLLVCLACLLTEIDWVKHRGEFAVPPVLTSNLRRYLFGNCIFPSLRALLLPSPLLLRIPSCSSLGTVPCKHLRTYSFGARRHQRARDSVQRQVA